MNKLHAKDLMIGDWIHCAKLDYASENYVANMQVKQLYVADLDTYSFKELKYEEIEPILLTSEILEKNGFKVDTIRNGACYYYDKKVVNDIFHRIDEVVRIEVFAKSAKSEETGLILLQIGYPDDCTKKIYMEIRYVHELQHAMRICGIEKEIKL